MYGTYYRREIVDDLKNILSRNGFLVGIVNYRMNDVVKKRQSKPEDPVPTVT